ncbi:unnamed protein product [Coffea canephora]|uniref:Pentacotripeptide-repeat region of PRORP domain-containing protein n=1 Tax=Coffea canephora TaxID=49390 RepID=A0A068U1Z2_COFCA|nr:unnamed protein product [Coffea canephora]
MILCISYCSRRWIILNFGCSFASDVFWERMAKFLLSKVQTPIYRSIIKPTQLLLHAHQFTHGCSEPAADKDAILTSICDSLSKDGLSWDSLTQKFSSVHLTIHQVEKVLIQLKEPINAKQALKFFHWSAHNMNLQHGMSSYCITIHILVKARLFKDAKALLESILVNKKSMHDGSVEMLNNVLDSLLGSYEVVGSTPFVFDLFMQTCAKLRIIDSVVDGCKVLDERGFGLSVISYNTLLHVMQKSEKTYLVWSLYEHMIDKRTYPNEVTYRILVRALGKEGRLKRFLDVVERIHGKRCSLPGMVVNTCLVFGLIDGGKVGEGMNLLKKMLQKNIIPDTISFSLVIMAKVRMGDLDAAWEVYEEMRKRGFEGNSFVSTSFIGAYCKQGKIEEVMRLMREMDDLGMKPYDETFNHLIEGCSGTGYLDESLKFCERMVKMGLLPSPLAFNMMVGKLCSDGEAKRADEALTVLLEMGFVPDENTYSHLANGYMTLGDVERILKLYYEMEYRSLSPCSAFLNSLIIALCRHGRVREADEFLNLLKARSLIPGSHTYKTLIASHLEKGNKTRAQQLCEEMVEMS